jgi:hypothetical protein
LSNSVNLAMPNNVMLEVNQPVPGGPPLIGVPYPFDNPKHFFIAVHGTARGIKKLAATIVYNKNGKLYAIAGKLAKKGLNWVFGFPDLPMEEMTYFLTVTPMDELVSAEDNAVTVRFKVVKQISGSFGTIPVISPLQGSTVCPTFPAWGQNGPNGPPTRAAMKGSSGVVTRGSQIPNNAPNGPPTGTWLFNFTNLPEDDYTFYVDNDPDQNGTDPFPMPGGTGTDQSQNPDVTVDSTNCGPPPAAPTSSSS